MESNQGETLESLWILVHEQIQYPDPDPDLDLRPRFRSRSRSRSRSRPRSRSGFKQFEVGKITLSKHFKSKRYSRLTFWLLWFFCHWILHYKTAFGFWFWNKLKVQILRGSAIVTSKIEHIDLLKNLFGYRKKRGKSQFFHNLAKHASFFFQLSNR